MATNTPRIDFVTGIGHFVQGDVFNASTTDRDGKPRVVKTGPNAGQANPQVFVKVALPKTPGQPVTQMRLAPNLDAEIASGSETGKLFAIIKKAAADAFPHLFPQGAAGPCTHPAFSYKIADGDGFDENGKPWASREGFAGKWVLTFTRNVGSVGNPQVFTQFGHDAGDLTLTAVHGGERRQNNAPGSPVRPGDFAKVAGNITGNNNSDKPGVYLNLDMLCAIREGAEIVMTSGPDATAVFGGQVAPANPVAAAAFTPAPSPQPVAAPAPTPVAVAPAPAPAAPAPAPAAPPPAPAAPLRQMTAAANGVTYEAHIAAGWTDEQLIANGLMLPQQ